MVVIFCLFPLFDSCTPRTNLVIISKVFWLRPHLKLMAHTSSSPAQISLSFRLIFITFFLRIFFQMSSANLKFNKSMSKCISAKWCSSLFPGVSISKMTSPWCVHSRHLTVYLGFFSSPISPHPTEQQSFHLFPLN